MFGFGDKSSVIDKARRVVSKGEPSKAVEILKNALTDEESDLPLILEIMHTYNTMDKLNEVIVWAKKGEDLSKDAERKVITEVEDLFYGRNHPDVFAEYLLEKNSEKRNFEDVSDVFKEMTEDGKKKFLEREEKIFEKIQNKDSALKKKDLTHFYLLAVMYESQNSEKAIETYKEIIDKSPDEIETVIEQLRRANRDHYGDPYLQFGLGEILLQYKDYSEGISNIRNATKKKEELEEKAISVLSSYRKESEEIMDYLSELLIESGREEKAMELIDDFEPDEAIKKFQRMVKKNPDNPEVHRKLGKAYLDKDRYLEGLNEILSAVEISPDEGTGEYLEKIEEQIPPEIDNYLTLAQIYRGLDSTKKAIEILEKGFSISPSASSAIVEVLESIEGKEGLGEEGLDLKAKLLSREGKVDSALDIYRELASRTGDYGKAREGLSRLKEQNPLNTEIELTSLMLKIPEAPEEAAQQVNLILTEEPDYVPYILTEYDKWVRSHTDQANEFLTFFKGIDREKFPDFTYDFAVAELNRITGDFESAKEYYLKAAREAPDRFNFLLQHLQDYRDELQIRITLASLYFDRGRYSEGKAEIKGAVKNFPDAISDIITFLIRRAKRKEGKKELAGFLTDVLIRNDYYEEALRWGRESLDSMEIEERGELLVNLAKAEAKTGDLSKAASLARKAVSIDESLIDRAIKELEEIKEEEKEEPDVLMALYELYRRKENIKKAINSLEGVLTQKPSMADIIVGEYEKLIEISPIDAELRLHYGKAKLLIGDSSGFNEIEKGVRFEPDLKEEALDVLTAPLDRDIEEEAVLLRAKLRKELGYQKEAVYDFFESYWKNEDDRPEIIQHIEESISESLLDDEMVDELFKIYENEGRNRKFVEIIDSFFDGSQKRGNYLLNKINVTFGEKVPVPIRIMRVKLLYRVGDKEQAKSEMRELLETHPEVASNLKEIINFDDEDVRGLLINIYLVLSEWNKVQKLIKKVPIEERLEYYEKLLDKNPDSQEAMREAGYLYFLLEETDKAELYLNSLDDLGGRERVILWLLGDKEAEVSKEDIENYRETILRDRIRITASIEKIVKIYIKLGELDKAFEKSLELDGERCEIMKSLVEINAGDYEDAYQRLSKLEQTEEVRKLRAISAMKGGNPEIALSLITDFEMEPTKKKNLVKTLLEKASKKYREIYPLPKEVIDG